MYKEHLAFTQPANPDIKVWRYMDFTKLVSLLDSRCLFFTRADRFEDPFEGSWPRTNVEARLQIPNIALLDSRNAQERMVSNIGKVTKYLPKFTAINCWHINPHESAAMWKLYLKSNEGVAIQSTYNKLKTSLIDDEPIYLGKVNYIDYEKERIDGEKLLAPFVHKRMSFVHEQEVRAIVTKWPSLQESLGLDPEPIDQGLKISVDIEHLIERIHTASSAPTWLSELIRAVTKRYGYDFEIQQSRLDEQPIF